MDPGCQKQANRNTPKNKEGKGEEEKEEGEEASRMSPLASHWLGGGVGGESV